MAPKVGRSLPALQQQLWGAGHVHNFILSERVRPQSGRGIMLECKPGVLDRALDSEWDAVDVAYSSSHPFTGTTWKCLFHSPRYKNHQRVIDGLFLCFRAQRQEWVMDAATE